MNTTQIPALTPEQLNYAASSLWKAILKQALADLRVAIPARVITFDAATQTVSAQILVSELVRQPNGPEWTQIAPINKVPVLLPRAGGFCITLPIKPGDEGLLVFCDSCIDQWWVNGGIQPPPKGPLAQPSFERRRHDLTDCGFYPGLWNQTRVLPSYSVDSAQVRSDDGTTVVDIAKAGITLSGPKIIINSDGDIDLNADGDINLNPQKDINLDADGKVGISGTDFSMDMSGDADLAANDIDISAGKDFNVLAEGEATVSPTGPLILSSQTQQVTIEAETEVLVQGNSVNINSALSTTSIDGRVFKIHIHTGVQTGGGVTGPVE